MEYFNSITEALEDTLAAPDLVFESTYYSDFEPTAYTTIKATVEVHGAKVKGIITFTSMTTDKYEYVIEGERDDTVCITSIIRKKFLKWCNETPMEE